VKRGRHLICSHSSNACCSPYKDPYDNASSSTVITSSTVSAPTYGMGPWIDYVIIDTAPSKPIVLVQP
jgi:hypothetical protein